MKAIRMHEHGGPDVIHVDDVPDPKAPGPGEIKVNVRAMALNHMDVWVRDGLPGIEQEMPFVMGCDAAGDVGEIGAGVEDLAVGDRVVLTPMVFCGKCAACLSGEQSMCSSFQMRGEHVDGNFAEQVVVKACAARKITENVTFENAAAFCLTFLTAWRMLMTKARLLPGETVLIHGIGGGVALAALTICNLVGARAVVTSSQDWKIDKAKELGAAAGFNYKTQNVAKEVFKFTQRKGVDVVVDSVSGVAHNIGVKAAKPGGRIVVCGVTGGDASADLTRVFWKQLQIFGSTMGNMREFGDVIGLLNTGKLSPVVDRIYRAEQVRDAHEYLTSAQQFGKVVLTF
jgi:NADPH:quinone reductase-like Zn-dependent oxidoreductase